MALILDTGPLYASLDRSDQDHAACRELIERAEEPILIPAPVLVEVDSWISRRLTPGVLVALIADIEAGAYRVVDLERADYTRIRELCDRYADADIAFVDAAVFAVVERLEEPSSRRWTGGTSPCCGRAIGTRSSSSPTDTAVRRATRAQGSASATSPAAPSRTRA